MPKPRSNSITFRGAAANRFVSELMAAQNKPKEKSVPDTRGIYHKFNVTRTDGSSEPGGKHEHCRYYVLDLDHDPHAAPALEAYASSCRKDFPALSCDLTDEATAIRQRQ